MNFELLTKDEASTRFFYPFPCDVYLIPEGTYIDGFRLARDVFLSHDGSEAFSETLYGDIRKKGSVVFNNGTYSLRGYFLVGYGKKVKNKYLTLSRLMALVMGLSIDKKIVIHKNNDSLDNHPSNLTVAKRGSLRKWW